MAVPQFQRLVELTSEAFDLPPAQRVAYLQARAADDPDLLQRAIRLVLADEEAEADQEFLKPPDWDLKEILTGAPDSSRSIRRDVLARGTVLCERFQIGEFLDRGGMGEVYSAFDSQLGETVALKTISPEIASNGSIDRFKKEVSQTRSIRHPNVCRVNELFRHDWPSGQITWFLTMELLSGRTLAAVLDEGVCYSPSEAHAWCAEMIAALAAAHALGIIHRDFKPRNVMLVPDGRGRSRAVVMDFGISIDAKQIPLHDPGEGTPTYMAPEQSARTGVTFASDQYSLGLVMYEVLTGRRYRPDADLSGLPRKWAGIIERCLAPRPQDRWPALDRIVDRIQQSRSRRDGLAAAAVLGAVLSSAGLVAAATRYRTVAESVAPITSQTDYSEGPALARSADLLVYASDRAESGNLDIWIQKLPGGQPRRLTTSPMRDDDPAISPDGRLVVFRSERPGSNGIYMVSASGGPEHLLIRDGREPQFSPDGKQLAYWTGTEDEIHLSAALHVYSFVSGQSRRIAEAFVDARSAVWDDSGGRMIFRGCRQLDSDSQCPEFWIVDPHHRSEPVDTGVMRAAAKQELEIFDGVSAWTGGRLYFAGRQDYEWSVWATDFGAPAGARFSRVANTVGATGAAAVAENRVVYSRQIGALHIWQIPVQSGGSKRKLTDSAASDCAPHISADGRLLLYFRSERGKWALRLRDLYSDTERVVFESGTKSFSPVMNPAGTAVAFEQEVMGNRSVQVLDVVTGQITTACRGCSKPSAWIPGTASLICTGPLRQRIVVVDTVSGRQQNLFSEDLPQPFLVDGVRLHPASGRIVFAASSAGGTRILQTGHFDSANLTVSNITPITETGSDSLSPVWDFAGNTIYYLSNRDGHLCIWSQPIAPGDTRLRGSPKAISHFHNSRLTPALVPERHLALSAGPDSIYLNAGEAAVSIWSGRLHERLEWPWSR